ncbi:DNA sulfur modification protein DndB [Halobacteriovorax marinus]|uniref:DNA sulfur modification protein DndB n=1 Tax=Halobacteriovorax marinus TaxID=97084 RepID=UPI000BC33F7A|nr:DNA sulfur modification protein DndB [Halobacteriovorax marinus]ATH07086.1 DNA sulfur modification protein DndB [Halobacteriovorax marinus]
MIHSFKFPAIRGVQSGREFFTVMCPLRLVSKLFTFTDEELRPELRAQRILNKSRIPEIRDYIVNNPKNYTFSSITASIDSEYEFEPLSSENTNIGNLTISMDCRFIINDGQHRRAAIEEALKERPELGNESISVVMFIDEGLKRSQQIFSDLNRHAIRPTNSIGILYDHRDPMSSLTRELIECIDVFNGLTEKEKSSISNRSTKLFTLSAIHNATKVLLSKKKNDDVLTRNEKEKALEFWTAVTKNMPDWKSAKQRKVNTSELREECIHAHGVALQALGEVGKDIIRRYPKDWKKYLNNLPKVDWSRSNSDLWEGAALINGRVSKSTDSVKRTSIKIKEQLHVPLNNEDKNYISGQLH